MPYCSSFWVTVTIGGIAPSMQLFCHVMRPQQSVEVRTQLTVPACALVQLASDSADLHHVL